MVVAVVGTSFQHSGALRSIKRPHSCVHCSERSPFSPSPSPSPSAFASPSSSSSCLREEDVPGFGPSFLLILPSAACSSKISRLGLPVKHRQKARPGRIFLCHGAQLLPESNSAQAVAAEGFRGINSRGRGQTQYRRGGPNAAANGETYSGEADESEKEDNGSGSAAVAAAAADARAATLAVEESTNDMVEKFAEESLGMDGIRSKTNRRGRSSQSGEEKEEDVSASSSDLSDDERFLRRAAVAEDADAVLALIAERELPSSSKGGGCVSNDDCSRLILVATAHSNAELAFSILKAMRTGLRQKQQEDRKGENDSDSKGRNWSWPRPDVGTYVALVRGLAASLRVSDAIQIISDVRRRGVPLGDEVPFGKVVNCPTCRTSLTVVQPQHGVQLVPCSKCRYKYELVSGVIVSSESESISSSIPFWQRGLRMLPFRNCGVPAAVHSVVVRAPDGLASTHRFATESADIPAQEGERVTMVLASPGKVGRGVGPIRFNARAPGWQPREPMAVSNHVTGQVSSLIRAPASATGAGATTSYLFPAALILASTDAASALIDPSLPSAIAMGATVALVLGGAAKAILLPRLNQLPERTVGAIALRQRLLAQYEKLQRKLAELTEAASDEVRMLARMCQLQNKMEAVGEASYSARIERVQKARQGLDERLSARLELMDSYAKVASMVEIEVEMDIDVLAAEAASPEATIAEQIESLMDVERLQKEWKNQAEANDEVERLLRSPLLPS